MDLQVAVLVVGGLILAAVLWVVRTTQENTASLAKMDTKVEVLTSSIDKHVLPDIQRLAERADQARDAAMAARSAAERLDERVLQTERGLDQLWKAYRTPPEPQ